MKDRWGCDEEEVDLLWEDDVLMVDQRNGVQNGFAGSGHLRDRLPAFTSYLNFLEGHNKIRRQSEMEALEGSPKVSFSLSSDVGKACR